VVIGPLAVLVAVASAGPIPWRDALAQPPAWYASDEAVRVADNVLLYQRDTGGWPKNIDMAAALTEAEKAGLAGRKSVTDSTIDNGATYTQLAFLARVFEARRLPRHEQAFLKGLDYLFQAQYENGGWPQYYPRLTGYYKHITFNDDAMTGVLSLLRDVATGKAPYGFVDRARRDRAQRAVAKGIDCILKTQVVVDGKPTVWCAQHDEVTLAPAAARTYELPSLSGYESVGIVRFLMAIPEPDQRVKEAVRAAAEWFDRSRITGIRWVDGAVVRDPAAPPLWARFYEIGTNRPIFSGRDGVKKYDVAEIEEERRIHYRWYVTEPARLLEEYRRWRAYRSSAVDTAHGDREFLLLWPDGAPGALGTGPEDKPKLTVYRAPVDAANGAAVVVCPGGGYRTLASDHEGRQVAEWLNGLGLSAFVLQYRVGPRYRNPAPLQDAQQALRLVRSRAAEFGVDPARVGIMGFSAGGHLAATTGTDFEEGARPDFMILAYPVISFAASFAHKGSVQYLLGDAPEPKLLAELSVERRVSSRTPPTFLFHTTDDASVSVENSLAFFQALHAAGVSAELHVFPHGRHGVGLAPDDPVLSQWPKLCAAWLQAMGFTAPAPRPSASAGAPPHR
jgi:PelA/Pel-15E family pectate lyase